MPQRARPPRRRSARIAGLTRAAAEATTLDELTADVLPGIVDLYRLSFAACYVFVERHLLDGYAPAQADTAVFGAYAAVAPSCDFLAAKVNRDPRHPVTWQSLLDPGSFVRSPSYNEFWRRFDVEQALSMPLCSERYMAAGYVGLALLRSSRQGEWSREEREEVARIAPSLTAACRRHRRVQARLDAWSLLAEREDGPALVAIDAGGRPIVETARARELLAGTAPKGTLPAPLVAASAKLWQLLQTEDAPPPQTWRVALHDARGEAFDAELEVARRPSGEPLVVARLSAMPRVSGPRLEGATPEGVAESAAIERAVERAAACHGLTPAEREVLSLLVQYGFSNREIAVCLSVSPETVRTHMKRVFDKLGVDSRLQAVLKVNGVVRHPIG